MPQVYRKMRGCFFRTSVRAYFRVTFTPSRLQAGVNFLPFSNALPAFSALNSDCKHRYLQAQTWAIFRDVALGTFLDSWHVYPGHGVLESALRAAFRGN